MSVYDDIKKALESSLAPSIAQIRDDVTLMKADIAIIKAEVKATGVRIETLEKNIQWRFEELKDKLDLHNRVRNLERERDREAKKETAAQ